MTFLKGHQKVQAKVCYFLFIQIIENMWREMIVIGSRTVTATVYHRFVMVGFDKRKSYADLDGLDRSPLVTPTFAKAEGT